MRTVTAWPTAYPIDGEQRSSLEQVQARLMTALAAELAGLAIGERLRMVTAFTQGTLTGAIYLTGANPVGRHGTIGALVGLEPWSPNLQPLPVFGGTLVTPVFPVEMTSGQVVPFGSVARLRFDSGIDTTIWTVMVEQLVAGNLPIAVVVEAERRFPLSHTQQMMHQGLARRAQERNARRSYKYTREDAAGLGGDYAVNVGVVGDLAGFSSIWTATTTLGLRIDPIGAGGPVELGNRLMSANSAAKLFPMPVLPGDSPIPVPRHRPRASTATRRLDGSTSVTIAVTDTGVPIQWDPITVNRHLLVLGDPGSGKSLTTMSLLRSLWERFGVPWLVIDPLKFEYARLQLSQRPVSVGSSPLVKVRHLHLGEVPINPLVVPAGVDSLGYASAMAQAFSSVTSLGEAFPLGEQIVRTAFNDLYANPAFNATRGPTFADLEAAFMAAAHQEAMTGETARNVRISLLSRLRSVTSGVAGNVFAGGPRAGIDWVSLSEAPTVITFPRGIGEQEKSVIYALLVASHWSWRLANPTNNRHVIALEEIHQVYGRNNPAAAQMLDTLLATMRDSGQGYLAITQNPHQLGEMTQRLFPNMLVHRLGQHSGLAALDVLSSARAEVAELNTGEVLAVLSEPRGVRGRVRDYSSAAGVHDAMVVEPSYRAEEFTADGQIVRGWCSACPRPCTGRSWLGYAEGAAIEASRVLAAGGDTRSAAKAAAADVRRRSVGVPDNPAGTYCAAARGVCVALGVRGASDAQARSACQQVRGAVTPQPDPDHGTNR